MTYIYIVLPFLLSCMVATFCIPQIIVIAYKKRLFDNPEYRKIHHIITPRLGGVAFFVSMLLAVTITIGLFIGNEGVLPIQLPLLAGFCSVIILFFVGIADDLIGLKYRPKLIVQVIAAILTVSAGFRIDSLYGVFANHLIPVWISIPITILFIIYVINTINLIDGIDGLAAGVSGFAFTTIGVLLFMQKELLFSIIAFASLGMLIPFFYYNVFAKDKYKIFMGDNGSLLLGYLIAFLILCLVESNSSDDNAKRNFVLGISSILIPAFDVIWVMLCRIKHGEHIFKPDKNHIHHRFLTAGFSSKQTLSFILLFTIAIIVINALLLFVSNINIILFIDILLYMFLNIALLARMKKRKLGKS